MYGVYFLKDPVFCIWEGNTYNRVYEVSSSEVASRLAEMLRMCGRGRALTGLIIQKLPL
jgi:hypothetical protein